MTASSNETPELPQRKDVRLKHYDYASPGVYFVTICTRGREMLFGHVAEGCLIPTNYGAIAIQAIDGLSEHYQSVSVDCSVVMPNHVHLVLWIQSGNQARHTLGNVVRGFKSEVARKCGRSVWQRGYHEHIVRNEQDLREIQSYVANNPMKWELDRHNPENEKYEMWRSE